MPICGKPEYMIRHLRTCSHISLDVKDWASKQLTATELKAQKQREKTVPLLNPGLSTYPSNPPSFSNALDLPPAKRARTSGSSSREASHNSFRFPSLTASFDQGVFEIDVLDLFISNGWAWNGADSRAWLNFLSRYIPSCEPVSSRQLSGPILDRRVSEVEKRILPLVSGKLGTGQCDGWKNVTKASLVSSLVTVDGEVGLLHIRSKTRLILHTNFIALSYSYP